MCYVEEYIDIFTVALVTEKTGCQRVCLVMQNIQQVGPGKGSETFYSDRALRVVMCHSFV